MRKAGVMIIFLLIHGSSYCWSAPKANISFSHYQHRLIEKLAISAPMEMELIEEKFISNNFNCSKLDVVRFDSADDFHLSGFTDHGNSSFVKHRSARLHLWIKVFRN